MGTDLSCVYILTNARHTVLYIGVTSNLLQRIWQHKEKLVKGFTQKYHVDQLVYYEVTGDIRSAIEREKQLKAQKRQTKIDLINTQNPTWRDLTDDLI